LVLPFATGVVRRLVRENRPMSVVGNFVRIGKVSGSFVTNKLK
jgi:hypothetical protein